MCLNRLILSDLIARGEDKRRDLGSPDTLYRDGRPGAEARRDDLAQRRRGELAVMPLVLSHVFVHRVARAAAGAAALVFVAVVMLATARPRAFHVAPGLLALILAVATLAVYTVASWLAEHVFERRMRAAIATGADVHTDLDRLAAGPVDVALRMIRRVDGWSLTGALAGANAVALLFGFLLFTAVVARGYPGAWIVALNVAPLGLALAAGTAIAALVGIACDRELRRDTPAWLAAAAHRVTPIVAGAVLSIAWSLGKGAARTARITGGLPTPVRIVLGLVAVTSVAVLTTWVALWWRRREYARVAGTDTSDRVTKP
jgi:hypothetical protein